MTFVGERLGLGGAQFGLDYGITNTAGCIARPALRAILELATEAGIAFADTAPAYGSSEQEIGLSGCASRFRLVSKTPKLPAASTAAEAKEIVNASLDRSLERLKVEQLDSVLVHNADDLIGVSGEGVWAALQQAKLDGRVRRVGASIYRSSQITRLIDRYPIDIVQVPLNVLDRRLERGGQLARLTEAGVAVHARSLFLQGLILCEPDRIPPRFGPLRQAIGAFHSWASEQRMSLLEAALAYPLRQAQVECCIIGIASREQLEATIAAAAHIIKLSVHETFEAPCELSECHLDPSKWNELR